MHLHPASWPHLRQPPPWQGVADDHGFCSLLAAPAPRYRPRHLGCRSGLEMLAQGAAPLLYITGVGEHVTTEQMLEEHASPVAKGILYHADVDIELDHVARSTVSNADQSAAFLRKRGIKSIRLITANYHMKRSMHEFKTAIPEITILADAVFPEDFKRDEWWLHPNTRRLVFSEFYKYGAVLLRDWLKPGMPEKA